MFLIWARWLPVLVGALGALATTGCQQQLPSPTPTPAIIDADGLLTEARQTAEAVVAYWYFGMREEHVAGEKSRVEFAGQWTASGDIRVNIVPIGDDGVAILDEMVDYLAVGGNYYKKPDTPNTTEVWRRAQSLDSRGLPPAPLIDDRFDWTLVDASVTSSNLEHHSGTWHGEGYHFRGLRSEGFEEDGRAMRNDIVQDLYVSHEDMLVRVLAVSVRTTALPAGGGMEGERVRSAVYTFMNHNPPVISITPPDRVAE